MENEVITSAIAIVNAKRIWRGGSAFDAIRNNSIRTNNNSSDTNNYENNGNNNNVNDDSDEVAIIHNDHINGHIEGDNYFAEVDGLLIIDGTITFIGSSNGVRERFDQVARQIQNLPAKPRAVCNGRSRLPFTRLIDCHHCSAVFPGFIDSHVHFLDGGRQLMSVDLSYANCKETFVATLRAFVEQNDIIHNDNYYHINNEDDLTHHGHLHNTNSSSNCGERE